MILWFSGTGNSRSVAEKLSAELSVSLYKLTPQFVSNPLTIPESDNSVIWVCPVYSWGIPPYVRSVIAKISIENSTDVVHHLVLTCGDDCGLAADMWRHDIRYRGWKDGAAFSVNMPNNYVCMKGFDVDPAKTESKKLALAPDRISEIAVHLSGMDKNDMKTDDVVRGRFAWIKTKVIYPWFIRHAMSPKPFKVTADKCISCGKCAAACPLNNIRMERTDSELSERPKRRPVWGDNCAGCLACYHICPRHAVSYGSATKGKGHYVNPCMRGSR